jgi:hypothetical protein
MYGQVGTYADVPISIGHSPQRPNHAPMNSPVLSALECFKSMADVAYERSRQIRTIAPEEKDVDLDTIERAQTLIRSASQVYVLGYGFDDNNNRRLKLDSTKRQDRSPPNIFFTNFGDNGRINKRASTIFLNIPNLLEKGVFAVGNCQKSDRDVYSALEIDFEFFS